MRARVFASLQLAACAALLSPAPAMAERLSLSDAIAAAVAHAPSVERAEAMLRRSESLISQAWALVLPRVETVVNYTHWDFEVAFQAPRPDGSGMEKLVIQNQDQFDARNSISLSLFNYSALPLIYNAYDNVDLHKTGLAAARRAVAFQAASAYVQVVGAHRAVALAEASEAFYAEHLRAEQTRLDRGVGDKLAVIRSNQEHVAARHHLANAQRAVEYAKESLALVMERSNTAFDVAMDGGLPALPAPVESEEALVAAALERREDVLMADTAATLADRDIDNTWGDFLPRFDASFNHTWSNAAGFAGQQNRWNIVVTATWTWFDGGLRYGQLDEKRSALAEALVAADQARQDARAEVLRSRQQLRDASARLEQAFVAVTLAREALAAATRLFDGGLADYLRVFDAKHSEQQAELAVLQAQVQVELAQLGVLQAVGFTLGAGD